MHTEQTPTHGIVYLVKNKMNGKCYVGQTVKLSKFDSYYGSGKVIKLAIKKYGLDNFEKVILRYCCDQLELDFYETFYINEHKSLCPNGYNIGKGGGNKDNFTHNPNKELIRENMKLGIKNKRNVDEWRKKIQDTKRKLQCGYGNKNGMYGKTVYEVWVDKYGKDIADFKLADMKSRMSESHIGMLHTEEEKRKIGKANKGKIISAEHAAETSKRFKGKKLSQEHKKLISQSIQKLVKKYKDSDKKIKKPNSPGTNKFAIGNIPWNKDMSSKDEISIDNEDNLVTKISEYYGK